MEFFNSAVDVLQTLVIALGAGLGIWGRQRQPRCKKPRHETVNGGRRRCLDRPYPCSSALRPVWLSLTQHHFPRAPRHAGRVRKEGLTVDMAND